MTFLINISKLLLLSLKNQSISIFSLRGILNFSLFIHYSKVKIDLQLISNLDWVFLSKLATYSYNSQNEKMKTQLFWVGILFSLFSKACMNHWICDYTYLPFPNLNSYSIRRDKFQNSSFQSLSYIFDLYAPTITQQTANTTASTASFFFFFLLRSSETYLY